MKPKVILKNVDDLYKSLKSHAQIWRAMIDEWGDATLLFNKVYLDRHGILYLYNDKLHNGKTQFSFHSPIIYAEKENITETEIRYYIYLDTDREPMRLFAE
jgi:hypothetical protein